MQIVIYERFNYLQVSKVKLIWQKNLQVEFELKIGFEINFVYFLHEFFNETQIDFLLAETI